MRECTCGHIEACHARNPRTGRLCSGYDTSNASGMCGCTQYVAAPSGAREPDAWDDEKAVRGTLVEIISESKKRGALVYAMGGSYQTYGHVVDALLYRTPAPSEPLVTEACEWFISNSDWGTWSSGCGKEFEFNDDGPKENGFNFCHACGKRVTVAPAALRESRDV